MFGVVPIGGERAWADLVLQGYDSEMHGLEWEAVYWGEDNVRESGAASWVTGYDGRSSNNRVVVLVSSTRGVQL